MVAPDGMIRIPLNESQDEQSQIEEFLRRYNGEGIQHIALHTDSIFETVEEMKRRGIDFQDTIFGQDRPVLESQRPKRLPLAPDAEVHSAADRISSAYRRYLRDSGITFGVIP